MFGMCAMQAAKSILSYFFRRVVLVRHISHFRLFTMPLLPLVSCHINQLSFNILSKSSWEWDFSHRAKSELCQIIIRMNSALPQSLLVKEYSDSSQWMGVCECSKPILTFLVDDRMAVFTATSATLLVLSLVAC